MGYTSVRIGKDAVGSNKNASSGLMAMLFLLFIVIYAVNIMCQRSRFGNVISVTVLRIGRNLLIGIVTGMPWGEVAEFVIY
jgi:hypothetical protein